MVKAHIVLVSAVLGVVAALTASLFFSSYSQTGYARLADYAIRLEENLTALEAQNARLLARADLYRRNRDAVAVEARALGYVRPNESVIRITDRKTRRISQSPGTILNRPVESQSRRYITRVVALIVFLLSLVVQLLSAGAKQSDPHDSRMRRASR